MDEKLVESLNEALRVEVETSLKNLYHSLFFRGPGGRDIAAKFEEEATGSLGHALALGKKIAALGGEPRLAVDVDLQPKGHDTAAMVREAIEQERRVIEAWTGILGHVEDNVAMKSWVESTIVGEQRHVDELLRLLPADDRAVAGEPGRGADGRRAERAAEAESEA